MQFILTLSTNYC